MGIPSPAGVSAAGIPPLGDKANVVVQGTLSAVGPGLPIAIQGPMNISVWTEINTTLTTTAATSTATVASATSLAAGQSISGANIPLGTTIKSISGTTVTMAFPTITQQGTVNTTTAQIGGLLSTAGLVGSTVTVPSNAEGVTIPGSTTVTSVITAAVAPTNDSPGVPGVVAISAAPTAVPANSGPVQLQFALTNNSVTTGADTAAIFTGAAIGSVMTIQVEYSYNGGAKWLVANVGGSGALGQYACTTPLRLTFGEPENQVLYRLNCTAYTSGGVNYRMSATGQASTTLSVPAI